jgi:hypothetical protein
VKRDERHPRFEDWLKTMLLGIYPPTPARGLLPRRSRADRVTTSTAPRMLCLEDALLMPRFAAACGHREIAPAAFRLDEELEEYEDFGSAERAYRQAHDSGRGSSRNTICASRTRSASRMEPRDDWKWLCKASGVRYAWLHDARSGTRPTTTGPPAPKSDGHGTIN